jgi:DNA-binding protein HU-alpha
MTTKTSAKTSGTRKTTTTRKTAAKTAPAKAASSAKAKPPAPAVVTESQPVALAAELKKRELLELVLKKTDVKKKFAKPVVDAMIEVLGEAIAEGRSLNLQSMGKVLPQRTKDAGKNRVIVARIRQSKEAVEASAKSGVSDTAAAVRAAVAPAAE